MSDPTPPLPIRKSLRAKGLLATLGLLAYLLAATVYIAIERGKIHAGFQSLGDVAQHEKVLALLEVAINGALVEASQASATRAGDSPPPVDLRLNLEGMARLFGALEAFDPSYALPQRAVQRAFDTLSAEPVRNHWIELRESLRRAADEMEIRRERLAAQRDSVAAAYQRQYDAVTVESLLLATLGLVTFGTFAGWFFARLARDILRLEEHASQIVRGTRGVSLEVRRQDELGQLIRAVNRMAADLDERERQIRIDGERRLHQEKMMAVGALAAGVAHEVNNPLAVISGLAQELRSLPAQAGGTVDARVSDSAAQILAQAERAAQAARHLAEVAAPQPADLDWLDLNALLRHVVQLMGYDRRYRRVEFGLQADSALPAVRSSAHAIQQVLMQMLSLVCDALVSSNGASTQVEVRTQVDPATIAVQVLFAPVLVFARPDVQRSLLLCRAIVEPVGARLAVAQVPGPRQCITLTLPADSGAQGD